MEMKKCPNGHYYDASIHADCPYCNNVAGGGVTLPLGGFNAAGEVTVGGSPTMPLSGAPSDNGRTVAMSQSVNNGNADEGRTVALIQEDKGIDPVVGWIVCIDGAEKGRDYKIHADNNFIGRSDRMDICIRGDETISRENHAVISYDVVDNTYYFRPGDGRAIVRLNDKALFEVAEIKPYDKITIGKTQFMFMPFCGEKFQW
jgi:hypothetical protein